VIAQLREEQVPGPNADSVFAPRPSAFALPTLTDRLEGHTGRWGEITFRVHNRDFLIFVGIAPAAPRARIDELLRILAGLGISARR
jgi:hypothetical protein